MADHDQRLSQQADEAKAALDSAGNAGEIKNAIEALKKLLGARDISPGLADRIKSYIAAGSQKLQEEIAKENAELAEGAGKPPRTAFESAVFGAMTQKEKDYYLAINPDAHYQLLNVSVDANGNVVTQPGEKISGQVLREDVAFIKFCSLSDEERKPIQGKAPATQSTLAEMDNLRTSIDHIEGFEASKAMEEADKGKISREEAHQRIRENRKNFRNAHEKIDRVAAETAKAALCDSRQKPAADAMLRHAREELRQTLKKDVLEKITGEEQNEGRAVHVNEQPERSNLTTAANALLEPTPAR